jgi:hypothetical protein
MNDSHTGSRLKLPSSLQSQLHDFRRRVWWIKSIEAVCGALFGVVVSYLAVFVLDRITETPAWIRIAMFAVAMTACAIIPVYFHRWIWRHRRLEQLAHLVSRRFPGIGDQILGVIELVRNELEQSRSRALCEAAIKQVAHEASRRNLRDAVPNPRHRMWLCLTGVPTAAALFLWAVFPAAATNAWARFAAPWKSTPRYTFTQINALPDRLIVAHGEPIEFSLHLRSSTRRRPEVGTAWLGRQPAVTAELTEERYHFSLPPQIDDAELALTIGDWQQSVRVRPMLRPELTAVTADVQLPEYMHRKTALHKDVRSGSVSLVKGATAIFTASPNRNLSQATFNGKPTQSTDKITSPPVLIDTSQRLVLTWTDEFGLTGMQPFTVALTARDDEPPSVVCEDLPRHKVVLDLESLHFKVRAQDDFGIKRVGIEWKGVDSAEVEKPAKGEQIFAAGAGDKETIELAGVFCAQTLGIEPQPIEVRIYAEDYLPGRARVYSPVYLLHVLSAEQHSIWLTEQLSKWHRQSLEVRDRELQLLHANQQLRLLTAEDLNRPETRSRIEAQSQAERANGRRLNALVGGGEELVRQAMRNPEFGVGHLEKWAEMLQILKDIAGNRMPNVADLLKQSAQAQGLAAAAKAGPKAGQIHSTPSGGYRPPGENKPKPPVPQVVDAESSQQSANKDPGSADDKPSNKKSNPRLTLPVTTIADQSARKPLSTDTPESQKLDEAVIAQQDLLAEFEKIADELNKVLANLEGSTLVKRLKSISRKQYVVAGKITDHLSESFGESLKLAPAFGEKAHLDPLDTLSTQQAKYSQDVSTIMDDMQAYFERRRFLRFKTVLDEMRDQDAVGSLRQLGDDLPKEVGMSIAQCEFWSDAFDRWADNLVDPACSGKCPGCKSKSSLPPSIVLEAMQILESEVNLREETRVAEQARSALAKDEYATRAGKLHEVQEKLSERVAKLNVRIQDLPDGASEFAYEIGLLQKVEQVMDDAAGILVRPETGPEAIGAETEAIELLLRSKRINPRGGGGGGSSPGGGGQGTTNDSALALLGAGLNEREQREDRGITQTTGESGASLPEEFRAGLDEYFNRLEADAVTQ